ncbi:MAG: hypothetical protein AB7S99_23350 [Pseudodonghicola sp.]
MTGDASLQERATGLMRVALSMLDEAGELTAAAHLQAALDALPGPLRAAPNDELSRDMPVAADPVTVRAMGGALAVLGTLMGRKGIASVEEISGVLGIYAVTTAETSRDEGLILGYWAAVLRDVAQSLGEDRAQTRTNRE